MRGPKVMVALGAIIFILIVLAVALAPVLTPYSPTQASAEDRLLPSSSDHPMGTDNFGRDILTRILHGGRTTLPAAILTLVATMVIGLSLGLVAAVFDGTWLDTIILRAVDVLLAFPFMVLAMAVSGLFGRGLDKILLVAVFTWWASFARLTKSLALPILSSEPVTAARICGASTWTIIYRYVIPEILGVVLVNGTFELSSIILSISTLSFFGLGNQPPQPEWGSMLADGRKYMSTAPQMLVWPTLIIFVLVLSLNFMGEGLRDLLNPYEMPGDWKKVKHEKS